MNIRDTNNKLYESETNSRKSSNNLKINILKSDYKSDVSRDTTPTSSRHSNHNHRKPKDQKSEKRSSEICPESFARKLNRLDYRNFNRKQCELTYQFVDLATRYSKSPNKNKVTEAEFVFDVSGVPQDKLSRLYEVFREIRDSTNNRN